MTRGRGSRVLTSDDSPRSYDKINSENLHEDDAALQSQLAQPAPGKTCGSCTLCCKVVGIAELKKPADVWCGHCNKAKGCRIYDTRPQVCRKYSTENCEYHGGDYNFEKLFTSADALHEYAQEQLREAREQKRAKRLRKDRRRALRLKPQALLQMPAADVKPPVLTVRHKANGKAVSLPVV